MDKKVVITVKKLNELEEYVKDKKRRALSIRKETKSLKSKLRLAVANIDSMAELSIRSRIDNLEAEAIEVSNEIDENILRMKNILGAEAGEYDAFIDFRFRSGENDSSSWVTISRMQHHGVPTRLLDWTETLIIAIYFAIEYYIVELDRLWENDKKTPKIDPFPLRYHEIMHLPEPAVWVLNPYKLSREATGKNVLWSPSQISGGEYFESFFLSRNWPFAKPVPMYSPWENPRIAAQQGIFTVHGFERDPLDKQVKNDMLRRIVMPRQAAIYGAKLVQTAFGLNHFALFRDRDRLGVEVTKKYLA